MKAIKADRLLESHFPLLVMWCEGRKGSPFRQLADLGQAAMLSQSVVLAQSVFLDSPIFVTSTGEGLSLHGSSSRNVTLSSGLGHGRGFLGPYCREIERMSRQCEGTMDCVSYNLLFSCFNLSENSSFREFVH